MGLNAFGLSLVAGLLIGLTGCGSREESANDPAATNALVAVEPAAAPPAEAGADAAPATTPTEAISAARGLLKSGQVDEAAARLVQAQMQSTGFDTRQAKDYRQAYSEAYDRALDAIQRGDPKGEAALQLLRAAAPR